MSLTVAVNGAADAELSDATQVEVYERMGETTTYRLRYPVDIFEGDLPMLVDKRLAPGSMLSILASSLNKIECLVHGPVHGQAIHLEHGGAGSWIEVLGSDTSVVMDREARSAIWSDLTDSEAVSSIVANYGYTPDVESTQAGHLEDKHTLVQRESDLRFVRRLARRNGYLFWVTCDPDGLETAHFKPPPLDPAWAGTAKLIINLKEQTRIATLDITWDVERPTSVIGAQLDLNTKDVLDGSVSATSQTLLGGKGLADIAAERRSVLLRAPADDAGDLQSRGGGALSEADWFLQATCETSVHAMGGEVIRAHMLAEVSGAGSRHSGTYFIAGVRHTIDSAAHRMELTLLRNAWE